MANHVQGLSLMSLELEGKQEQASWLRPFLGLLRSEFPHGMSMRDLPLRTFLRNGLLIRDT